MTLFRLLGSVDCAATPQSSCVHIATWNGHEHPFQVYREGRFQDWQAWQSKRYFTRKYVVALVPIPGARDRWLFAGCYLPKSVKPHPTVPSAWLYDTDEDSTAKQLAGRVVVQLRGPGRPHVRKGEALDPLLQVAELREHAVSARLFTSYSDVSLPKADLDYIVRDPGAAKEWPAALSAVWGVYVITDTSNGKLYVGSATAETSRAGRGGIWERWCQYSADGHGGDVELKAVLREPGIEHANRYFQYSILEVAPLSALAEHVKLREGYWKAVLDTKNHGYNGNIERIVPARF